MKVIAPVRLDGSIDPRWGRAEHVAIADVVGGDVARWDVHAVAWDVLHDQGTDGAHHARIARFLLDHQVELVVADHMGPGMQRMLATMGVAVRLGAAGDARAAVAAAV